MNEGPYIILTPVPGPNRKKKRPEIINRMKKELLELRINYPLNSYSDILYLGPMNWRGMRYIVEPGKEMEFFRLQIEIFFKHLASLNETNRSKGITVEVNKTILLLILEYFNFTEFKPILQLESMLEQMITDELLTYIDISRKLLQYSKEKKFKIKLLLSEDLLPDSRIEFLISSTNNAIFKISLQNEITGKIYTADFEYIIGEKTKREIFLSDLLIEPGIYKFSIDGHFKVAKFEQVEPTIQKTSYDNLPIIVPPQEKRIVIHPPKMDFRVFPTIRLIGSQGCNYLEHDSTFKIYIPKNLSFDRIRIKINKKNLCFQKTEIKDNVICLDYDDFDLKSSSALLIITYNYPGTDLESVESKTRIETFKMISEASSNYGFVSLRLIFSRLMTLNLKLYEEGKNIPVYERQVQMMAGIRIDNLYIFKKYSLEFIDPKLNASFSLRLGFNSHGLPPEQEIDQIFDRFINYLKDFSRLSS